MHFIVNDVFMCFHFGMATSEIVESFLPGAILNPPSKAISPIAATIGGLVGPVCIYFILLAIFDSAGSFEGKSDEFKLKALMHGWGIPTATDITINWSAALIVFGKGHPAITFLLLLCIADDAIGMVIIAVVYPDPHAPFKELWMLMVVGAMVVAYGMRQTNWLDWRLYVLLPGGMAWYGLLRSSLHPALALVFVVPFMPTGIKSAEESAAVADAAADDDADAGEGDHGHSNFKANATLFEFSHGCAAPTHLFVLFLFGLCNCGVDASNGVGPFAWVVALALMLGKLIGASLMAIGAAKCGFPLPKGMSTRHAVMVRCAFSTEIYTRGCRWFSRLLA
jgi:NhaA family Na+:H+ antiporter